MAYSLVTAMLTMVNEEKTKPLIEEARFGDFAGNVTLNHP